MPGYNTFQSKQQVLENEIHELKKQLNVQRVGEDEKKNLLVVKGMMELVLKEIANMLPSREPTVYQVPEKDDDFRIYLGYGKYYKDKANIYLTIDPITRNFKISQKNVMPPSSLTGFVTGGINFEHPILSEILKCIQEKFPENFSLLTQQQQTKQFL
jgi:hypothetical protein